MREKMNILVVIDMQNDFIDGALGTKEAVSIAPKVLEINILQPSGFQYENHPAIFLCLDILKNHLRILNHTLFNPFLNLFRISD